MKDQFTLITNLSLFSQIIEKHCPEIPDTLPSPKEIISLSHLEQSFFACLAWKNKKVSGIAVFTLHNRRHKGVHLECLELIGNDFFDYNLFFCDQSQMKGFLCFITEKARKSTADAVLINNILLSPASCPHLFEVADEPKLFKCTDESQLAFDFILKKKSLRRHRNKLLSQFNVTTEHLTSNLTRSQIAILAEIHKARWAFDGISSGFENKERIETYLAHTQNKILTVLKNKDEIIAIHYGMVFDKTLLWHTPAINIKYLEYSPLEVLLYETALFCREQNFNVLDFGLGQEPYKKRFSNTNRTVYTKLIPLKKKGWLCYGVNKFIRTESTKKTLSEITYKIKATVKNSLNLIDGIHYYTHQSTPLHISEKSKLLVIRDFNSLYDLFRINNLTVQNHHYQRIKGKNIFLCLVNNNYQLLSYGWATFSATFFVSEVNQLINNGSKIMLYDYFTPENQRNSGYYSTLLMLITDFFKEQKLAIFASKKNIASNKAIIKAGFEKTTYSKSVKST